MRILYWTQLFWPYIGGVEVHAMDFIEMFKSMGYEFTVVTSHGHLDLTDEDSHEGIQIFRFPFQAALSEKNIDLIFSIRKQVAALKQQVRPDLIHIQVSDPSFYFHLSTANACPVPTIYSIRTSVFDHTPGSNSMLIKTLRSADHVTANSGAILDDIRRMVPEISDRSSCIYSCVNMKSVRSAPLSFDPPKLLCIGRVVEDKGFDIAVRTVANIIKKHPDTELIIAGDGPAREALMRLANSMGIPQSVTFAGWVNPDKIPELINSATVVLVPSRWREAFGLVALQAARMARPVIAANTGGLAEIVVEGETGFLVEKEDVNGFSDAVSFLLDHPAKARRMGKEAEVRARDTFSWEKHVNAFHALYQSVGATI